MTGKAANHEGVQAPGASISYEAENRTNIVTQDDMHEIPAVDEPRALKYFIILRQLRRISTGSPSLGVLAALVEIQDLLSDILRS